MTNHQNQFWVFRRRLKLFKNKMDHSIDQKEPTKRQVMRLVMSVFDPLGLIQNFTIKVLLYQFTIIGSKALDGMIQATKNFSPLEFVGKMTSKKRPVIFLISYSDMIPTTSKIEIHIFNYVGKEIHISLIMAKAKIAPAKPLSILRCELQAAIMGSIGYLQMAAIQESTIPLE